MNSIIDDATMSLREKKQWLKKLQKSHPDVYDQHFSDMLWDFCLLFNLFLNISFVEATEGMLNTDGKLWFPLIAEFY